MLAYLHFQHICLSIAFDLYKQSSIILNLSSSEAEGQPYSETSALHFHKFWVLLVQKNLIQPNLAI